VDFYQDAAKEVVSGTQDHVTFNLIQVDCRVLKRGVEDKATDLANATLDTLVQILKAKNELVDKEYSEILTRVQEEPVNPEELVALRDYVKGCQERFDALDKIVDEVNSTVGIFGDCNYITPDYIFDQTCQSNIWPSRIEEVVRDSTVRIEEEKHKFIEELRDNQVKFEKALAATMAEIAKFEHYDDLEQVAEIFEKVLNLESKLESLQASADLYNSHEELLGFQPTAYPQAPPLAHSVALVTPCALPRRSTT
jgi:hypothetical protein